MLSNTQSADKKKPVYLPSSTWNSLKNEFNLSESDIENFVVSALDKMIAQNNPEINPNNLSPEEANEIEDNLKGLGYL